MIFTYFVLNVSTLSHLLLKYLTLKDSLLNSNVIARGFLCRKSVLRVKISTSKSGWRSFAFTLFALSIRILAKSQPCDLCSNFSTMSLTRVHFCHLVYKQWWFTANNKFHEYFYNIYMIFLERKKFIYLSHLCYYILRT